MMMRPCLAYPHKKNDRTKTFKRRRLKQRKIIDPEKKSDWFNITSILKTEASSERESERDREIDR